MKNDALRSLDELIFARSILQHPFYLSWKRGELTREQLATYSQVYYPHVAAFPNYLRNAIACSDDPITKSGLQANLADELTNPAPHPEIWLDFAEGVGADRAEVSRSRPSPKTADTVSVFEDLTRSDIASGLAALYAYESQQPQVASEKLRGLRDIYQLEDARALRYFEVHAAVDVEHGEGERRSLNRCLRSGASPEVIMQAANRALDAYWNLLDAVCEEATIECAA